MRLGALLVLLGLLLVLIDFALARTRSSAFAGLLHAGVLLIGVGVLIGHTGLHTG